MALFVDIVDFVWFLLVAFTVGHYWASYADRHADVDLDA